MRRLVFLAAAALLCASCSNTTEKQTERSTPGSVSPVPSSPAVGLSPSVAVDHDKAVRAATAATRATSAHIEQKVELGYEEKHFALTIAGDFDFAADRGNIAVDFPGGGIDHTDAIFADGLVYVSGIPDLRGKWASLSRTAAEAHYLLRAPLNDPEHVLEQVSAISETADVGREDVDGVPTTHYRGVLVGDAVLLRLTEKVRAGVEEVGSVLGGGRVSVPTDVWVDSAGRVIRTRLTFEQVGTAVSTTMTLSRLGAPVLATPPSPERVVPADSLTGILNG